MLVNLVIFLHGCCGVWPSLALFIHTCFMKGNCKDRMKRKWESIRVWSRVFLGPCALRGRNLKTALSLWKRFKSFPSTLRLENFEHTTISGHFGYMFEESSGREITWLRRFRKAPFSKCVQSALKHKADVFKFPRFEERFWKSSVLLTD